MEKLQNVRDRAADARDVLDYISTEYSREGVWPSVLSVHRKFRKSVVRQLFTPLNSAYVAESESPKGRVYQMQMIGMLSASQGDNHIRLLRRFFEYLHRIFPDPKQDKVTSDAVAAQMGLNAEEVATLGQLLSIGLLGGLLRMNGGPRPEGRWEYSLPEEIDEIGEATDLDDVLEQRILRTYEPNRPVFLDQRAAAARAEFVLPFPTEDDPVAAATVFPDNEDRRYQVFVSSTYDDLKEERSRVMRALLMTKCIPAGMELFPAASVKQWKLIQS